jgi:hypothetical protein
VLNGTIKVNFKRSFHHIADVGLCAPVWLGKFVKKLHETQTLSITHNRFRPHPRNRRFPRKIAKAYNRKHAAGHEHLAMCALNHGAHPPWQSMAEKIK